MTRTLADTDREPPDDDHVAGGVEGLDRLRLLLAGAMGTVLLSYALLVPSAALVIATAGGAVSIDGAFAAAIPLWLAAHQIPLVLEGQPLSLLPLLPTAGVIAVIAFGAAWSVRRLGGRPRHDAGAVVAALAGAHAAVAVLGSALLPRAAEVAVAPWSAMVGGGLVAAAAAALGVVRACGLPPDAAARLPGWLRPALRGAAIALAGLAFTGAIVVLTGLVLQAEAVADAYARLAPGFGAGVGVTLLAGAYLPNAVVVGVGWALGPGVAVGSATASPFVTHTAEPSSFPLLAALPSGVPPVWALAVFLLPLGVGVLTGLAVRRAATAQDGFAAALATVGLTAVAVGALSVMAGGRLATGPFDPVRLPVELLVPAAMLWVGVPVMLISVLRPAGAGAAPDEREVDDGEVGDGEVDGHGVDGDGVDGDEGGADEARTPDAAEPDGAEADVADRGSRVEPDVEEGGPGADPEETGPEPDGSSEDVQHPRGGAGPDEGVEQGATGRPGSGAAGRRSGDGDARRERPRGRPREDEDEARGGARRPRGAGSEAGSGEPRRAGTAAVRREDTDDTDDTAAPSARRRAGSRVERRDPRRSERGQGGREAGRGPAALRRTPASGRAGGERQGPVGAASSRSGRGSFLPWRRRGSEQLAAPPVPEQDGPQTVGELVAQRAQEAAEREARPRRDGGG
ncbi:DUF6350 family protein [Pseudonocardia kunmingensis]|uniref:CDP-diglyceride synthetase n=1 Tax=Pseudonocardia kunmingensis TaxID=630975 RepID=A0A543E184_9PSEU|nr:DUF6350 family protein [Pseudonocardia kunmingensis]TQM15332.1 CDP-diglyceride synthetase [Pseudonocardia kunmingensis]